jgi:peptidoglycan/LPS O-acetylase OafA/YrhL
MKDRFDKSLVSKDFPEKLGYIPSLDGLRALSIIMVSLIHTFS